LVKDVELHTGAAQVIMERNRSLYKSVLLDSTFLTLTVTCAVWLAFQP